MSTCPRSRHGRRHPLEHCAAPAQASASSGALTPQSALFGANGANLDSLTTECSTYGVTLTDLASYEQCILRQHGCRAEALLRFEAPTAEGLLRLVGHDLASGFCP